MQRLITPTDNQILSSSLVATMGISLVQNYIICMTKMATHWDARFAEAERG